MIYIILENHEYTDGHVHTFSDHAYAYDHQLPHTPSLELVIPTIYPMSSQLSHLEWPAYITMMTLATLLVSMWKILIPAGVLIDRNLPSQSAKDKTSKHVCGFQILPSSHSSTVQQGSRTRLIEEFRVQCLYGQPLQETLINMVDVFAALILVPKIVCEHLHCVPFSEVNTVGRSSVIFWCRERELTINNQHWSTDHQIYSMKPHCQSLKAKNADLALLVSMMNVFGYLLECYINIIDQLCQAQAVRYAIPHFSVGCCCYHVVQELLNEMIAQQQIEVSIQNEPRMARLEANSITSQARMDELQVWFVCF